MSLPERSESIALLDKYIEGEALQHHCYMVATAMQAYAEKRGKNTEMWYQAGLLHDLDWEKFPDEHPNKALNEILTEYPEELRLAIAAHGPERTGKQPETLIERYLYACDEISGFLHAYSLMRPNGFEGMKASKVRKKLKDMSFAAGVIREDIARGFELIDEEPADHLTFLIEIFQQMDNE